MSLMLAAGNVLMSEAHIAAQMDSPADTAVVSFQPRTPAAASGAPVTRRKATQIANKIVEEMSVGEGDCATSDWVTVLTTEITVPLDESWTSIKRGW
jgi:hypothetical protein